MNMNKYSRQIAIPFVGILGQEKIRNAKVAIIGAGALGHSTAIYLAASGIGHISIFDHDIVEESNLSRQILFSNRDIGKPKAKCLVNYLKNLHSDVEIRAIEVEFSLDNIEIIPSNCNFIINASDNYKTRIAINLLSLKKNIPWIDIGILKTQGHFCVFKPGLGCYECLFPDIEDSKENCSLSGVLSPICGIIGSFAANEVIKYILEKQINDINHYISFEFLENNFKKFYWKKNSECLCCKNFSHLRMISDNKKINYDNFFMNQNKLKNIMQEKNALIVLLDEVKADSNSNLDFIFQKWNIQNTKERAELINENIKLILNKNFLFNIEKERFYKKFELIIFLCSSGNKSKIACETFRKYNFPCYYGIAYLE